MSGPPVDALRGNTARWLTWVALLVGVLTLTPGVAGSEAGDADLSRDVHSVQPYHLPAGAPAVTWWSEEDEHALYGGHGRARPGPPEPMREHSLAKW